MGMGYGANYADVIEGRSVQEICPEEFQAFEKALGVAGMHIETYATAIYFDDADPNDLEQEEFMHINLAYKQLQKAFYNATNLDIWLDFHNSEDNGDRYDDVKGYYWAVDGMYQLTEAGKKMQDKVGRKFYVTFG